MSAFTASVARTMRLQAERERAGGLVTQAAKSRVDLFERAASHIATLGDDNAGLRALERVQEIVGGEGSWTPGDAQVRALAKLDGAWASRGGREDGLKEPGVEEVLALLVEAGLTDLANHETRKTEAIRDEVRRETHQRKLAEKELAREREKVAALRDEVELVSQGWSEQAAYYKPIVARHAALLDGLITAEEAAELLRAGEPAPAKA